MSADERLDMLMRWWREHMRELLAGCEMGNAYALEFNRTLFAAAQAMTDEALTAAEIALVELDADWEGKMTDFTAAELALAARWLGKTIRHLERWYSPQDASYIMRLKSERRIVLSLMRGKLQAALHTDAAKGTADER